MYYRLQKAGATVTMIGSGRTEIHMGKHGIPSCRPGRKIEEVRAADFDALVIPGGFLSDFMRRKPAMGNFVCEMNSQGKVIGAICRAGWTLASTGIVKGRKITCFSSIEDDLLSADANYESDRAVIIDGKLVTSRAPADLPKFRRGIIRTFEYEKTVASN